MFLLDTDVLSMSRRPDKAPPGFAAWVLRTPPAGMFLSAVTIFEVELGILRIARRDSAQGSVLRSWLRQRVLPHFAGRILAFDTAVALRCTDRHVPDPRPERDAMIAATAMEHGLTLVTRNVADFLAMRVPILDPCSQ